MINKFKNYLNRIKNTKMIKKYECNQKFGNVNLKYLFFKNQNSDTLLIVFSGMNPNKAVYNYVNTLKNQKYNRLYILDDIGDDILGCYYIGINGNNEVEVAVKQLLEKIRVEYNIRRMVFCGTSRGGYAAINFGLDYKDSIIIVGAPQYYLGDYLKGRKSNYLLYKIAGKDYSEKYIWDLNYKIRNKIIEMSNSYKGSIYLHYSENEHTYREHIHDLIQDLNVYGYSLLEEKMQYKEHDEVAIYYPDFLIRTISKIKNI